MRKGFTLMELLAVIVLLGVILTITMPKVLNTIENTKIESLRLNADNYIEAVENSLYTESLNNIYDNFTGVYTITDNGKTLTAKDGSVVNINYNGDALTSGKLVIEGGKVTRIINGTIDNYYAVINNGNKVELSKTPIEIKTLYAGETFNSVVKNLANNTTGMTRKTADTTVKYIGFYAYGELPEGYTKKQLLQLDSKPLTSDGLVNAYYDGNGNIFVYSEYGINANTSMKYMFTNFQTVENIYITNLNTVGVTSMVATFFNCLVLKQIDLSNFDTSLVTNMDSMFGFCQGLEYLDLSSFNTKNLKSMDSMFTWSNKLKSINLSSFDTSSVTNMRMVFHICYSLTSLDLSNFDTKNVQSMNQMFRGVSSLLELDLSNFDSTSLTDMYGMFLGSEKIKKITFGEKFTASNVTTMQEAFYKCKNLKELDLSNFDTSSMTNLNYTFQATSTIEKVLVGEKWIIGDGVNTTGLFSDSNISHVELKTDIPSHLVLAGTSFNAKIKNLANGETNLTHAATDSAVKFIGFYSNGDLPEGYTKEDLQVLSSVDISYGQDGSVLAYNNNGNIYVYSEGKIMTNNSPSYLFYRFSKLESIDLSGLDISHSRSLLEMFNGCASLTSLDLTNFDITYVTNMNKMFYGTTALEEVLVNSKWKENTTATKTDIFTNSKISDVTEK